MASINSPFFGINYGWNLGEGGWNIGMDINLLVIGFLLKGSVDSFESTLPASPVQGDSVILTTDNKAYYYIVESWLSVELVEGFEFNRLSDDTRWRYTGGSFVQVPTNDELSTGLANLQILVDNIDNRVDNLETSVGGITTDASGLNVTSDAVTLTLAQWMTFVRDRANHTGTQLADTISDFVAGVMGAINTGLLSSSLKVTYTPGSSNIQLEVKSDSYEAAPIAAGILSFSLPTGGVTIDMTEDVTEVILPSPIAGKNELILQFTQDAIGGWTITGWPLDVDWLEGSEPVLNPTPASTTIIRLWNIGDNGWYGSDVTESYALRGELGTAAFTAATSYATAAQGALADSAVQPGDLSSVATSGAASDVAVTDAGDYYTSLDVEGALQEIGLALGDISAALDAINGEVV